MPAKSLELKHTIKLIQELTLEIDEIEAQIKQSMDEEIHSPILTIPGISYHMGQCSSLRLVISTALIHLIRYLPMPECLLPLINWDRSTTVMPIWKNVD